jgi:hypothetical protein
MPDLFPQISLAGGDSGSNQVQLVNEFFPGRKPWG